ncbi:hypothetical protein F4802DRAFT_555074 [Xylaria palmicola]|nr:hypothetical protein F4802DRAFT_555074 [Xylaria palmicola]
MIPSLNLQGAHAALLEWANAMIAHFVPERASSLQVNKLERLFNGALFSALLEILDPEYNPTRFAQSAAASQAGDETARSMHIIHIGLIDLAGRSCPKIEPLIKVVDFQTLDRDPTRVGIAEVLLVFLCVACFSEDNETYIELLKKLDPKYQAAIFNFITEVEAKLLGQDVITVDNDNVTATNSAGLDADLAHEAAIADLQREAEEAKRQAGSLRVRLDRLQDNYDELVQKHEKLQDEKGQLQKQIDSEAGNFDRHRLQRQLKENETLIANLENERNALVEERERLLKDRDRLEAASKKAEELIDENQELRAKNEELSKKANMADNLRKKVEASKHLDAEVATLRNQKMDFTKVFEELSNTTTRMETYKQEGEAYASKMQEYEISIADMRDHKLALMSQNQDLLIRVGELEQRSQLDEAVVKDLQEKIMMLDPSAVMDDSLTPRPSSLEDELNNTSHTISMKNLEVQRLQAENAVLKSTIGLESDKGHLVQEMEDLRNTNQTIQEKYNDMHEKFTVGQKQLDILVHNLSEKGLVKAMQACYECSPDTKWLMSDFIREEAYSSLRTQVLAEQNRSKHFERQLEAVREQLADKDRALLEARGDLAAVEMSRLDSLTELKNTDGMLAASLRAELDVERRKCRSLKDDSDAMQKQLLAAYIEKDQLRREAEQANHELQKAADGQTVSTDFIKQSEKMEKLRTRYKQLQQQYEQSELKYREAERTLKAVRAGSEATAQKAQTDQIIKNLQHENAMIATAWYDLSSRLQSNHYVLQRRNEVPKSWLNKQRNLVNATPRR